MLRTFRWSPEKCHSSTKNWLPLGTWFLQRLDYNWKATYDTLPLQILSLAFPEQREAAQEELKWKVKCFKPDGEADQVTVGG